MQQATATLGRPLVGRQCELAALWAQVEVAVAGRTRVALVAGDPGRGAPGGGAPAGRASVGRGGCRGGGPREAPAAGARAGRVDPPAPAHDGGAGAAFRTRGRYPGRPGSWRTHRPGSEPAPA